MSGISDSQPGADNSQPAVMPRAPLSEHEAALLRHLAGSVESMDSRFCCGGSVNVEVETPILLYLLADPGAELGDNKDDAKFLRLNGDRATATHLHEICVASPHGVGNQTVYDESYRVARELKSPRFGLNFDPLHSTNGILDAVSGICATDVHAKLYKLNSYAQGGFFKLHKDTPKSEEHIGTILVSLPSAYQGGELVLTHGSKALTVDWSVPGNKSPVALQWAFFFSDVVHEILPVTSGYRLTLAYDVFRKEKGLIPSQRLALDARDTPLFADVHKLWNDRDFLPNGGKLAFGLQHAYPVKEEGWPESFEVFLKGSDRILHSVLVAHDREVRLKAAYDTSAYNYDREWRRKRDSTLPKPTAVDDFAPRWTQKKRRNREDRLVLLTSDDFSGVTQGAYLEELSVSDVLQKDIGASLEEDVIWCRRPGPPTSADDTEEKMDVVSFYRLNKAYSMTSSYIAYGNEAEIGYSYVAAALFVTVPPAAERQMV